jgi:hypothetical protein
MPFLIALKSAQLFLAIVDFLVQSKIDWLAGFKPSFLRTVVECSTSMLPRIATMKLILMEQCIFAFSLIIEGTQEKVFQFVMPLKSIYKRNFGFIEQKMYL